MFKQKKFLTDKNCKIELLLVCVSFGLLWYFIFSSTGMFKAGFNYLVVDHMFIEEYFKPFNLLTTIYQSFIEEPIKYNERFFPVYTFLFRTVPHLYGLNPITYYISSLIICISTSISFYIFGKLNKFSILESILFSALIALGEQSSSHAYIFPFPESTATFLLSLGLIFAEISAIYKNNTKNILNSLFILFSMLAALNKESYILMLPALAFYKVWFESAVNNISLTKSLKNQKISIGILLIFFATIIAYIKLKHFTGQGYAGVDQTSFSIQHISELLSFLVFHSFLIEAVIIGSIFLFFSKDNKKNILNHKFSYLVFSGLIVLPQFVLFLKTGMNGNTHYLLPLVIGLAFLAIYPMRSIKNINNLLYWLICLSLIILTFRQFNTVESYFKQRGYFLDDQQQLVIDIKKCMVKKDAKILVYANPYMQLEPLYSFRNVVIGEVLKINPNNLSIATYGSIDSDYYSDQFKTFENHLYSLTGSQQKHTIDEFNNHLVKDMSISELQQAQAIVIFNYPELIKSIQKNSNEWLDLNNYKNTLYPYNDIGLLCKK